MRVFIFRILLLMRFGLVNYTNIPHLNVRLHSKNVRLHSKNVRLRYPNEDGSIFILNPNTTKWILEGSKETAYDELALSKLNAVAIIAKPGKHCRFIPAIIIVNKL